MLTARFKDSWYALSPEKQKEVMDGQAKYMEKWMKEGKLKEVYFLGNMKGAMVIFDLSSAEDLMNSAYEAPVFPFADAEITPLVDVDVVMKAQAK